MTGLTEVRWDPTAQGQAEAALAGAAGLGDGFKVEPARVAVADVGSFLRQRAPAVLKVPGGLVALRQAGRRRASVVAPDGRVRPLPLALLRDAVCREVEAPVASDIERLLESAGVAGRRHTAARASLVGARVGATPIDAGWCLATPPNAPLRVIARRLRLGRRLGTLVGAHLLVYALFVLAWAVVGGAAVDGRLTARTVAIWALVLAVLVPLRLAATWWAGTFALDLGGLLKRRLLSGILRLEPEEIRAQGAGQLLGLVLEAQSLETLALTGGYLGLLGVVELTAAAGILAVAVRGPLLLLVLAGWLALSFALGRAYLRRRSLWTDARLHMTHDLVERLVGHRTRLAQEGVELHRHDEERAAIGHYVGLGRSMDRAEVALTALLPQGWVAIGAAVLLLPSPAGVSPAALAIGIGGVLLASHALRKLVLALAHVAGGAAAWKRISPLLQAAGRQDEVSPPNGAAAASDGLRPLLEATDLVFRHHGRADPVLAGASFDLDAGDRMLLEGPSGGGKSTLTSLLAGLRLPQSGVLRLDGADRLAVPTAWWRRRVTTACQFHENHVLSASFAFNLLMGRRWPPRAADLAEAEAVCRELGLGPLLDTMPGGLGQMVGETGWQLSHGERSRLYLARALLQGADVVVLDESFAALDPEALKEVLACVLRRAPTLLVVAHE